MTFLQLQVDTTISANWFMAGAVTLVGILLWRLLNKMDARIEKHDVQINDLDKQVGVMKATHPDAEAVAKAVVRTLRNDPSIRYPNNNQ